MRSRWLAEKGYVVRDLVLKLKIFGGLGRTLTVKVEREEMELIID